MSLRASALLALALVGCAGESIEEAAPADPAAAAEAEAAAKAKKEADAAAAKEQAAADKAARKAIYAEAQEQPPADVAAPPADAQKTASGLAYKVLTPGAGDATPDAWDIVEVEYKGWTTDGELFDSSYKRSKTAKFPLNKVIPGWTEGVGLMKVGETTRFWIPEELAYAGRPGAPAGMLVFDVELKRIDDQEEPPPPPKTPDDVAAAPADAQKTASGLAYKVLEAGDGAGKKPGPTDTVKVHYSGWTTDGEMFDSSVVRGSPASFPLNAVISGWTEGLQLMSPGDSYRFWIPVELAYQNRPGKPAGMLVFDVQLLEVK